MLKAERTSIAVRGSLEDPRAAHILAYRYELHLRSDNSAPGVVHLRHCVTRPRAKRPTPGAWERLPPAFFFLDRVLPSAFSQVAVITGQNFSAFILLDVAPRDDPVAPQGSQAVVNAATHRRIAPRPA